MKVFNPKEFDVAELRECPASKGELIQPKPAPSVRTLKIEEQGDRWNGYRPKIRLMGQWLERAGFRPGQRVSVTCVASGLIELRSTESAFKQEEGFPQAALSGTDS